ncbi:MAG: amylo-alpha-1,6-glucosidase [Thermoprotei archaeon]
MRPDEIFASAENAEPFFWADPKGVRTFLKGFSSHYVVEANGTYPKPDSEGRSRTGYWSDYVEIFSSVDFYLDGKPLSTLAEKVCVNPDYAVRQYGQAGREADWFEGDTLNLYFELNGNLSISFVPSLRLMWPAANKKLRLIGPSYGGGNLQFFGVLEAGESMSVQLSAQGLYFKGWNASGNGTGAWLKLSSSWRNKRKINWPMESISIKTGSNRVDLALEVCRKTIDKYFTESSIGAGWFASMPLFSWYFAREGLWAAMAADRIGNYWMAKNQLQLLARYQIREGEMKGLMPRELVLDPANPPEKLETGYASLDSTPLWISTLLDYVSWSGDYTLLKEHRINLDMAVEFLTDENRYVNALLSNDVASLLIGWPETWALERDGPSVEINAIIAKALEDASSLYSALGDENRAEELFEKSVSLAKALSGLFSQNDGLLYDHLDRDGKPVMILAPYSIVPLWYGLLPTEQAEVIIERLGRDDFMSPWGLRSISADDPRYEKNGFYRGAVHPFMTAIYAAACFKYGFYDRGWQSLRRVLDLVLGKPVGQINEVYSGEEPIGIGQPISISSCSLALQAFFDGLLGAQPGSIPSFYPHLPEDLKEVKLLRGGKQYTIG